MLFVLVAIVASSLEIGDNPYQILGISKKANRSEIKAAYRKLTIKFHPDKNKEKDTTKIWVKINDAYELLNDPDRKARYDKTGSVSEESQVKEPENPFGDVKEQFFQKEKRQMPRLKVPVVNAISFDDFIDSGEDCLFLIYSSTMIDECLKTMYYFEEFYGRYYKNAKCGRIDVSTGAGLARTIGATSVPSIVYVKKTDGKTKTESLLDVQSVKSIVEFLTNQWPIVVYPIKDKEHLDLFVKAPESYVKVVQFVRNGGATIWFKRMAMNYSDHIIFGVFEDPLHQITRDLGISSFPTYFFYRNIELPPLKIVQNHDLLDHLANWSKPVMFEANRFTFSYNCQDLCFIRGNKPKLNLLKEASKISSSTGYISTQTKAAQQLGLNDGEWVAIFPKENKYSKLIIRNSEINAIISFQNDLKRGKIEKQALPNGFSFDITKDAMKIKAIQIIRTIFVYIAPYKQYASVIMLIVIYFGSSITKRLKNRPKKQDINKLLKEHKQKVNERKHQAQK